MPQLSCPVFRLAMSEWGGECEDQWLEVSDGISGMKRFCGRRGPQNVVVSETEGLRDLYITFRNKDPSFPAKFECSVTCGVKGVFTFLCIIS